nr:hypothetical protein Iba_chr02dCG3230 [Ipomoea batatas]
MANVALPNSELLVIGVHVIAEDGYEPYPGDDDALLRVLLPLGGGGGENDAETPGERPDSDSRGEVRHRLSERVERNTAIRRTTYYFHRKLTKEAEDGEQILRFIPLKLGFESDFKSNFFSSEETKLFFPGFPMDALRSRT